MAASQGYGKIVTNGLIFAYDTADVRNSFKGQPKTNLLLGIGYSFGTTNDPHFKSNYGTEYDNIPGLGGTTLVHYCNFFNDYNGGSGACCPNVFNFGNFSVSPSTTYTYQIIYKTPDGYANPNYMYHYEFGPGGYVTEYGLWDGSRTEDLGNGWIHAWGTYTTNASTNYLQNYLFHYQYTQTKIQIAGVMLTQGSNIIPPKQFLSVGTSRSATQGLLPLVGNSSIDLTNISFDSNAQMYFDGTNDSIYTPDSTILNPGSSEFTVELVFNCSNASVGEGILYNKENLYETAIHSGYFQYAWQPHWNWDGDANFPVSSNTWYHAVVTYDKSYQRMYKNGVEVYNRAQTGDIGTNTNVLSMGARGVDSGGNYGYNFFPGQIPIVKIYKKALTTSEITQNYNKYKTRFNLS